MSEIVEVYGKKFDIENTNFSKKQLETIASFGKEELRVHVGVSGCGKTQALVLGFGLMCKYFQEHGLTGLRYVLVGKTVKVLKSIICNELTNCFGNNFTYSSSVKDGISKDAILYGQYITFIGMSDGNAEERFRGISNINGVYIEEMTLITEKNFEMFTLRVRGVKDERIHKLGFCDKFILGATNPDNPMHWLKKKMDDGIIPFTNWYTTDAHWKGSKEYYEKKYKELAGNDLMIGRMLECRWVSASGAVLKSFNKDKNIIDDYDKQFIYSVFDKLLLGVDPGINHPTGIVLVGTIEDYDRCEYVAIKCWKYKDVANSVVATYIKDIIDDINACGCKLNRLYYDPSAANMSVELGMLNINPIRSTNTHKGIQRLNSLFALEELYVLSTCDCLIEQIYNYHYKDNGTDNIDRIDDDVLDALRYAVYSYDTERNGGVER